MSTARPIDLIYGHLGEATYNTESHSWHFSRVPCITRRIKQIGQSSIILQPPIKDNSLGYVQSAVKRTQKIGQIAQKLPEIVPGVSLLPELAQTSEIINAITSRHDPTTSTLFAFGKARDGSRKNQKRHSKAPDVPILAAVGGPARNAIRLLRLGKEELGWGEERDDGLNILAPRNEEQGWWYGNGSPIKQLCFGQVEGDSSSWLAVRYHGATTILRPLLLPGAVPVQAPYDLSVEGHHQSTYKIDPKPIITLPIQKTGFYPHADVCFNPWNSSQFAIIDQQGNWSIWELGRSSNHRRIWTVKAGPKGALSENDADDTNSVDADDTNSMDVDVEGWGKILWVSNEKTIAVVNRRLLLIASLEEPIKYFAAPDLSLAKSDDWILDAKPSPLNKTHLFVTTSTRVFWLRVSPIEESEAKRYSASVLLCWRHFRDPEDTSLQMNVLKDEQTEMVVLYSRFTRFSTIFTFQLSASPVNLPTSVSDPYILPLDEKKEGDSSASLDYSHRESHSICNLELKAVRYKARDKSNQSELGSRYRECGIRFFQLTLLYSNLHLRQCLYAGFPAAQSIHVQSPQIQRCARLFKNPAKVIDYDFIVPNRYPIENREHLACGSSPQRIDQKESGAEASVSEEDPWTLNFEWLKNEIERNTFKSTDLGGPPFSTFAPLEQCLDLMGSAILDKLENRTPGLISLHEMLESNPSVQDIEQASVSLDKFITSITEISIAYSGDNGNTNESRAEMSSLATRHILRILQPRMGLDQRLQLSVIYDTLIASWIRPLSEEIPSRVRVTAEKMLRDIAAQLYLSSFGVRLKSKSVESKDLDSQQPSKDDIVFSLPVRQEKTFQTLSIKQQGKQPRPSSPPPASSQVSEDVGFMPAPQPFSPTLPTPERTPSLQSRSTVTSLAESEDQASRRLRALANLVPQPLLPMSLSNVLSHWSVGMDPNNYNWEAAQHALRPGSQGEDTENDATIKKRARKSRRQSRYSLNSSSQPAPLRSEEDNLPSSLSIRIKPPVARDAQGSSQTTEKTITVSQIEKGSSSKRSIGLKKTRRKKPGF